MCTASTQAVATSNGDTAVKLETQNAISDGIDAGQVEIVTLASTSSGKASPGDEPGADGAKGPGSPAKADSASTEDSATETVAGSSSILGAVNSADADSNPDSADSAQDTADESAGDNADHDVDANVAKPSLNDNKAEGPDSTQTTTSDEANASAPSPDEAEDVSITQPTTSDEANAAGDSSSVVEGGDIQEVYGPVRHLPANADESGKEVYGPVRYLTPQSTNTVTIHFDVGFSTLPTSSTITSAGYTTVEQLVADANKKFGVKAIGNSFDPIFDANGKLMFRAGDSYTFTFDTTSTATKNASLAELNAIFKGMKRYGYSPTQHTFIRMLNGKLMATNVNWSETNYFASTLASAMSATVTNAHIYTKWGDSKFDVQYYDTDGIKVAGIGGPTGWNDELKYPTKADYPTAVFEDPYKIYMTSRMYPNSLDPDCATPLTAGLTLSQFVNQLTGYGTSTHDYDLNFINPGQHYELVCKTQEVKVSFDVTYQPNGATGTAQKVTYDNLAATAGAKPTGWTDKVGHTFLGWAKTSGATTADYAVGAALTNIGGNGTPADGGNYTLYAVWKPNEYTVTYNYNKPSGVTANPGSWPANGKVNHGSNYTISSNTPTLTGYRFDGWATTAAGAVAYAKGATINNVTANVNLYAKWTAMYTVSYNGNGSTSGSAPASSTVAAGSSYTVAANTFTKTGAVFQGWNTAANGSGTAYAPGASFTVNANTTLYAQWATNPAISFNANTPSGAVTSVTGLPGSTTVTYNTPYTLPTTTPSVMGYTFAGWKIANAGTTYAAGGKTGNITTATVFYAQWTERTGFSAVFYDKSSGASDGTAYNTQSNKNWTAQITLPTAPTKTGYTFGGWFLQKDSNGSGTGTQFSAAKGFNQLWLDAQKAGQANESTTTIKLYAKWTEKDRVTFTLNPNGGQYKGTTGVDTTSNILNGGSFTIPTNVTNPTRVGYNFAGWTENAAGTGTVYQAGAVFNNLTTSKTLYAKWNAASVTFTFEKGATDVTALKTPDPYTMSANYGSNLAVPAGSTVYARTGFTHGGWSYTNASNANATVAAAGASVAVANFKIVWSGDSAAGTLKGTAVLTAIWNPYTYTIQWNANGGSPNTTTANVQPTTTVNVPASNPSRSGYTFKGWNTAADGSGKVVTSGSAVNAIFNLSGVASGATLPLYAQWEENKVQIRFYSDNYSTLQFAGTGYTDGTILYVGAATGAIYASATATTPISGRNISGGVTPVIDSNHEYSATSGSKWAVGAYSGTAVAAANIGAGGKLTVPKTGGLYTTADYYLTVSPKGIGFTVEYYFQDVNSDTTYTINASATTSDTAPFGYVVTAGTTAGTAGTTITIVRKSFTGFTYDDAKTGTAKSITIGGTPAGNVIKLYFKRNVNTVHVEYSGDVPAGAVYTPASQDVKYGATVNLTVPATVTGYTFTGWKVVSGGVTISSNSFTMPNNAVSIEGVWAKNKFNVTFKNSNTSQGTLSGTTSYSLSFDEHLAAVPTATAKVGYYFLGWEVHENCTTSGNESTGTNMGIVSTDALLGLDGTVATPWTCNGNAVMIARWGKTLSIVYTSPSTGGFTEVNGAVTSGVVTQPGTRYVNLQAGINLPQYGGAFDPAGDRNANNPKAKPGYKFTGWKFTADDGSTGTVQGYYNAGVFVRTGGANMPTVVNMSYRVRGRLRRDDPAASLRQ